MKNNVLKAEHILECLLDNLEEGIQVVDSSGKTIYYNSSMEKVEGVPAEKAIGQRVNAYLKDVKDEDSALLKAIKTGEKTENLVQHYDNCNNKEITVINTTVPIKKENQIIGAVEIAKDMTQLRKLTESICKLQDRSNNDKPFYSFDDIYSNNHEMKIAIEKAKKASMSNSSVIIYAETGSGKEVFSQSIHYDGLRKESPFVPINCAAIPTTLIEGMLFGTEKGVYTGAENKKGLFETANNGTILLDELNSMEPYLQSKLLRVLEDGYIRPLGSNKTIKVDVRIIATLNEDPEKLIEIGKLRKDLFFRLSVIKIDIPPLRERKEDIPIFIDDFIRKYNRILGKTVKSIDTDVMKKLTEYKWPGNVRELKNVIESAMNMSDSNSMLSEEYFDKRIINGTLDEKYQIEGGIKSISEYNFDLKSYIDNIEKGIIEETLRKNNYNIKETSKKLNISRQNLEHKIKKYKKFS